MTEARTCYERALAIVNFVEGCNDSDQAEIERNKVSLLLNLAAVHNANQDYGEALVQCSQVGSDRFDPVTSAMALLGSTLVCLEPTGQDPASSTFHRVLVLSGW